MRWTPRLWASLAAISGFVAVAAGAFAAHGMADPMAKELLRTGSTYELAHALATLVCAALVAGMPRARLAPAWFLGGSLLFSGSLYALALGAPRIVGLVTPFGGLAFLVGWAVLAWAAATAKAGGA
jgi:uncharacterized membrane protein YgdD (TMEM256/DUF423 family)